MKAASIFCVYQEFDLGYNKLTMKFILAIIISVFVLKWPTGISAISSGPHINDLNILLPPRSTYPVGYRLQGSGGCFSWSWDHHDVISLEAEYNETAECSTSAVVTSIAPYNGRRATAIQAVDTLTGQVIRCEVFVDKISKIKIFHHSVKLDLDGMATLRVRAFDSEENVFSSLAGLQFKWNLQPLMTSLINTFPHSLVHVPLKDTPLSDCGCICGDIDSRIELEQNNVGSDLYVVRGINVGQERVSVNLAEPELEHLADEIILTVAEAMFLEPPSPLYIISGTRLQYTLKTIRQNKPSVVRLPSPHHVWSTSNSSVALVESSMGIVLGQNLGSTSVVVKDMRVAGHQQMSSLHVNIPSSLHFYLHLFQAKGLTQHTPSRKENSLICSETPWFLVVDWDYVIEVKAFSKQSGSYPLFLTKDNDLKLFFGDSSHWQAVPIPDVVASEQGWHNSTLVKAISEGSGKISAFLTFKSSDAEMDSDDDSASNLQTVQVEQEVRVCGRLFIQIENHSQLTGSLILPWNHLHAQTLQLTVGGGCGVKASDYQWISLDSTVVTVSSLGLVQSKGVGKTIIRVAALTNLLNSAEVVVEVSIPSSISVIKELPVEVEVGSYLPVAITLQNPDGQYYSKCDVFNDLVQWKTHSESSILVVNESTYVGKHEGILKSDTFTSDLPICGHTYFVASQPGRETILASLRFDDWFQVTALLEPLEVSWLVSVYEHVTVIQAGDGNSHGGYECFINQIDQVTISDSNNPCFRLRYLRLVPGSSMKIMLQGGPERWGHEIDFIEYYEITSGSEEGLLVTRLGTSRILEVTCNTFGNFSLVFYRGNGVGPDHRRPSLASTELSVLCGIPASITLLIDKPGNSLPDIRISSKADRDSKHVHVTPLTLVNNRSIRAAATALDSFGNAYANASSLPLNWTLTGCQSLISWNKFSGDGTYGSWEQYLVLSDNVGQCLLKASVESLLDYKQLATQVGSSLIEIMKPKDYTLEDAVKLQIVTSLKIEPTFILLYFHPEAKAVLTVTGGTGNVDSQVNDTKIAAVFQKPSILNEANLVVAARGIGTAKISLIDSGLASPLLGFSVVCVADVAWLRMLLPEEASIPLGSTLQVELEAGDSSGNIFDSSQLHLMNMRVHLQDDLLEVFGSNGVVMRVGTRISGSSFTMRGARIGLSGNFYVSALTNSGQEIVSEFRRVEVYAPLVLQPSSLVLAPGAQYMVRVDGGPSTGMHIQFESCNETVAYMKSASGMLIANTPGDTILYAKANNNAGNLISKTQMTVKVQFPKSVVLNVKGGHLRLGQEMSVFISGAQEDLFAFHELCGQYEWAIQDSQVLSLRSVEVSSALDIVDAGFSSCVVGRSSGKSEVTVKFTCHFKSLTEVYPPVHYTATETIWVVSDLPLALGLAATWLLPPHITSSSVLPQATDTGSESKSLSSRGNIVYSLLQDRFEDAGGIILNGTHIKTTEKLDLACISARDRRSGLSAIALCIQVAKVSRMNIGTKGIPGNVFELSVGSQQLYTLAFQDHLGTPFHEVGMAVQLVAETNRHDVISIKVPERCDATGLQNACISVQALSQGDALIHVYQYGNPSVQDYILVRVGACIIPKDPVLHIGGHVDFSIVGKGLSSAAAGQWSSSNEDVIQINQLSGDAVAVGAGTATIRFNDSHFLAHATVIVVQVTDISILAPEGPLTNVHYPKRGYRFQIKFRDEMGHDLSKAGRGEDFNYTCRVLPSFVGSSIKWRDPGDGKFYCIFFPSSPEIISSMFHGQREPLEAVLESVVTKGSLPIKIIAEASGSSHNGSIGTIFTAGFSILELPSEIHFSPSMNSTRLIAVGNIGGLEVSSTQSDVLHVKKLFAEEDPYGVGGRVLYEIKATSFDKAFTSKLVFLQARTGQRVVVNVLHDDVDKIISGISLSGQVITATVLTLILLVFPLIFCVRLFNFRRPQQQGPMNGGTSFNPGAEHTPPSSRGFNNFDSLHTPSPATPSRSPPSPYTDYVSNTINQTPFYRMNNNSSNYDASRTY